MSMDQSLHILIVDDDRRITRTLSDILNVSGFLHQRRFKVTQATDPHVDTTLMTTDAQVILLGS